ncbi:glycosyltransferase family 1 protein [Ktedonosporobacter rubrisoli]|uniref:Glycosyltransferase family 1 protein n=1 Tax=Ktedonosporobacter rubrisoli TaxID=2509675 RepID=A0A4P6JQ77_KTERU|nr:glycosyltransferase family 1 protein [Ktedonosporobacter rubrisoli]QBD77568.1 glycosyltransferase family 1 protein [Ktedonosporobacter rubrisoli]
MRIAFFSETFLPQTNGIVTRLCHTLSELKARYADRVLLVAPEMPGLPTHYDGISVLGVPSVDLPFYRGFRFGLPWLHTRAGAALEQFAPEIIHAVNPASGIGLLALHYAARYRVPLVASFNTDLPGYVRHYGLSVLEEPLWQYLRWIHSQAALNLCPSRPVQERLNARGIHNVALWRSGVDTALFHPQHFSCGWREKLTNGDPDVTIILSVGRLAAEKGLDKLISTLPQLAGCHLAIVGDGPAAEQLRQQANGLPITFLGTLQGEDLATAYASADIFAQPSTTETFGFVTLEAMASGLPVVAARRGGSLDLVLEGETGLLFEPDQPQALERAVRYLAEHRRERKQMGNAARLYIEGSEWSWRTATAELHRSYEQVLAKAKTGSSDEALPPLQHDADSQKHSLPFAR